MAVYHFIGLIYKIGLNRCVDIPNDITKKLGYENFIPVKVRVNNLIKQTNLIPSGNGNYRLFVDSDVRKKSGKDTGDFIELEIERDNEPRKTTPPDDLMKAFEVNKTAQTIYFNSTENKQREIIKHLNDSKTLETRMKRIDYIIFVLLSEAKKRKRK